MTWSKYGARVGEHVVVGAQVGGDGVGGVGDGRAAGGPQVVGHVGVVGEQRRGGADLGAHVADGGLAGGGDASRRPGRSTR